MKRMVLLLYLELTDNVLDISYVINSTIVFWPSIYLEKTYPPGNSSGIKVLLFVPRE